MSQVYHSNAKTNSHTREMIQKSDLNNVELATIYNVNVKTISKHKSRNFLEDKSSRPNKIHYALSPLDKELIRVVRTLTWMELDDLTDTIVDVIPNANRSNVYRTLKAFDINKVPTDNHIRDVLDGVDIKETKPFFDYLHTIMIKNNIFFLKGI